MASAGRGDTWPHQVLTGHQHTRIMRSESGEEALQAICDVVLRGDQVAALDNRSYERSLIGQ